MNSCPEAESSRVMHAVLRVGDAVIMASDGASEQPELAAGNVNVALDFASEAELKRAFDALAASGEVVAPVTETPWGLFGGLRDAFGIPWMLNYSAPAR